MKKKEIRREKRAFFELCGLWDRMVLAQIGAARAEDLVRLGVVAYFLGFRGLARLMVRLLARRGRAAYRKFWQAFRADPEVRLRCFLWLAWFHRDAPSGRGEELTRRVRTAAPMLEFCLLELPGAGERDA